MVLLRRVKSGEASRRFEGRTSVTTERGCDAAPGPRLQHQLLDVPAGTPRASHFRHIVAGNLPSAQLGQLTPPGSMGGLRAWAAPGGPRKQSTHCVPGPRLAQQTPRPPEVVKEASPDVTPHREGHVGGGQLRPDCPHPWFLTVLAPLLQGQRKTTHPTDDRHTDAGAQNLSSVLLPPLPASAPGESASCKLETKAANRSELSSRVFVT